MIVMLELNGGVLSTPLSSPPPFTPCPPYPFVERGAFMTKTAIRRHGVLTSLRARDGELRWSCYHEQHLHANEPGPAELQRCADGVRNAVRAVRRE